MEKILRTIAQLSKKTNTYIVGGWLRDAFLRRTNRDLDLTVSSDPSALARKTARTLKGRFVVLDNVNRIYRVVIKENPALDYIDFAQFKGKDIRADLSNRDFTINAIALPLPAEGKPSLTAAIDPLKGKPDLRRRLVRMTSARAFKDDPLRLLRAFRLSAELGFSIDPSTSRAIKNNASLITRSAGERIRDELFKILSCNDAARYVLLMDRAGIMEEIVPQITQMKRSARSFYYHPSGLWQHALETLSSLEMICKNLDRFFPGHAAEMRRHLEEPLTSGITRLSLLKITALLHDAGKPACARKVGKRMRFLGHETAGADVAADVFKRLRIGRKEVLIARRLIEHHMRPISLGQAKKTTPRAAFRLFRDLEDELPDLLLLSLADCYSYRRLKRTLTVDLATQQCTVKNLVAMYFGEKAKPATPRLLDGHLLMQELRLKPGPVVGALLKSITEAQQLGQIASREEALTLAKKRLTLLKKKYKITVPTKRA